MKEPWELAYKPFVFDEPLRTPCVCVLWGDDEDRPIYVGRSENVFERIGVHANSFLGSDVRRVEIHYCVDREHMCMLEEDLIKWYRPKWNDKFNNGPAVPPRS